MFRFDRHSFDDRSWMLVIVILPLLFIAPFIVYIALALYQGDLSKLLLGGLTLAGICVALKVFGEGLVKLAIAIDEQRLRHKRLKPMNERGDREIPLAETPSSSSPHTATSYEERGIPVQQGGYFGYGPQDAAAYTGTMYPQE